MQKAWNVIVVGGGGSGLATAVRAAECGASVLLLEKRPQLGGTTGIAIGSFTANQTPLQRRAGINDSLADHVEDVRLFAPVSIEQRNRAELRQFFLNHSAETLEWLMGMGLQFLGPSPEPPNRVPRMHNVVPGAQAYVETLRRKLLQLGGTIYCQANVRSLLKEGSAVVGLVAEIGGDCIEFVADRGVVLAAGDYANSPELIARFKGEAFQQVEGINPHATGDGHRLAESAGANLVNMDVTYGPEIRFLPPGQSLLPGSELVRRFVPGRLLSRIVRLVPSFVIHAFVRRILVTWQHPENSLFANGAILVNQFGQRFCDELRTPEREIAIAAQPGKITYILLDQVLMEQYGRWPNFISTAPKIAYAYVRDYLRLRPDVAVKGTLSQIAARREINVDSLITTVESVNRDRTEVGERPLNGDQWVLLGPAKAYFTTTEGGAAINEQFQVLDQEGLPIPGLYAVGQNGLGGQILWGHGLHIAWAMTSGRLCGQVLGHPLM